MIQIIGQNNRPTNHKPGTHYVICLIEVWRAQHLFDFGESKNMIRLTECQSIKCDEAYSAILDTMELSLPKGSVLRKTISNDTESKKAYDSISISREDYGVVEVRKSNVDVAKVHDFSPGNRIRVYVGYTEDKAIVDLGRIDLNPGETIFGGDETILKRYKAAMGGAPVFDGYIVKCSDKTPITLYAEGMASVLKKISVKPCIHQSKSLSDILGILKLEETTGIAVDPSVKEAIKTINIPVNFADGMTVLDVFANYLKEYNLYARIVPSNTNGKYWIRIGYSFTSGVNANEDDEPCIYEGKTAYAVYSDYNVANDNLKYENVDPYYFVVKCHATIIEGKGKRTIYTFCMRLNPSLRMKDGATAEEPFIVFNEKALTKSERKNIRKHGSVKFDTSSYKVVDRVYPVSIPRGKFDKKKIRAWGATQFYEAMRNGVSGSLVLFGDYHLKGGDIISYVDARYKNRSGLYLIEKVSTTLSISGLRQEVTIPYKLVDSSQTIKENEE